MGRKAVGPVCCVMHVKEPRTLIVKEKGACPGVSGIRALSTQQGGYVRATNLIIIIIIIIIMVGYPDSLSGLCWKDVTLNQQDWSIY